ALPAAREQGVGVSDHHAGPARRHVPAVRQPRPAAARDPMRSRNRRLGLIASCVLLVGLGAACTGSAGGATPSSSASTALRPLPRPTDRPVNPLFDYGQDVEITAKAFVPQELVCAVNFPITWTNHSGHVQVIHFDNNGGIESGPIQPGGT